MTQIDKCETKRWYNAEGQRHRDDGPAVEYIDGSKFWYQNGQCHRDDGPAIERDDGEKHWYKNGKFHRIDGPAIEHANGTKSWYLEGVKLSEEDFNKRVMTQPKIDEEGTKRWYNAKGQLHRDDGPAIERDDGEKEWYQDGQCHRDDGPAIEWADGGKHWYLKGNKVKEFENKKIKYKDVFISDVKKAGVRQLSRKSTKAIQAGIIYVLRQQGLADNDLKSILKALQTEAGRAFISGLLGFALLHLKKDSEFIQTMGEEFRVSSIDLSVESGLSAMYEKFQNHLPTIIKLISSFDNDISLTDAAEMISSFNDTFPPEIKEEIDWLNSKARINNEASIINIEEEKELETELEEIEESNTRYMLCQ